MKEKGKHNSNGETDKPNTIFVVEDDVVLCRLIQRSLQRLGFHTEGAFDGVEAISRFADYEGKGGNRARIVDHPIRLMLLDYKLPDMTGRQVIEALNQRQSSLPFIIMTGHGDERMAVEMMKLGARDYLVKDQEFLELLPSVVEQVVEQLAVEKRLAEAEKALQESEQEYRDLVENMNDIVYITDENGVITYISPAITRLSGHNPSELIGRCFTEFVSQEDSPDILEMFRKLASDHCEPGDYRFMTKSGDIRWVQISSRLISKGDRVVGVQGVIMDITERKQAENGLKRYAAELEQSNRDLQQFAYVASHDLQEPLRMVSSYVQLLERRYKGRLDADADDFIAYAVDGAKRMYALINDLLVYSRVSTNGKKFAPTDCEAVFANTIANLQTAIEESGTLVTHNPLPTVVADDLQLIQLFQNLISNAIKFHSEEPSRVHVSAKQKRNEWIFSIRDNGIGINPEYADRIFVIFQRLHGRGKYPGTGIGLAICRRIVERHNGRIWVESQSGKGSAFYFTIPITSALTQ